jgi:hypothetical protein
MSLDLRIISKRAVFEPITFEVQAQGVSNFRMLGEFFFSLLSAFYSQTLQLRAVIF